MSNVDAKLNEILSQNGWVDELEVNIEEQKQAIKQLIVGEFEKLLQFVNKDTYDVCWQHSPDTDPMIHASRIDYLKEYIDRKLKEWKD